MNTKNTIARSIPYIAPMMRARLAGLKTHTRRCKSLKCLNLAPDDWTLIELVDPGARMASLRATFEHVSGERCHVNCPFGKPGHLLWTQETWRISAWDENDGTLCIDYRADGFSRKDWLKVENEKMFDRLFLQSSHDALKAGFNEGSGTHHWEPGQSPCRWRPPMFMPRCLSRGLDEIVGIRLERLNDISEADAIEEGIYQEASVNGMWTADGNTFTGKEGGARGAYFNLFKSINGAELQNPYAWVIIFKVGQP